MAFFGTHLPEKAFSVCIKDGKNIDDCCGSVRFLCETSNIPVCRVHTLCTPPSFRLPSARYNTPICSLDGAFSLHSTNGRKQKSRQKALLPRPSDGYRVQNKNASIVSILTFLYGGELGIRTLGGITPHGISSTAPSTTRTTLHQPCVVRSSFFVRFDTSTQTVWPREYRISAFLACQAVGAVIHFRCCHSLQAAAGSLPGETAGLCVNCALPALNAYFFRLPLLSTSAARSFSCH